jgi:hypothetical protein
MRQGICNGSEARLSVGPLQRSVWMSIVNAFDVADPVPADAACGTLNLLASILEKTQRIYTAAFAP